MMFRYRLASVRPKARKMERHYEGNHTQARPGHASALLVLGGGGQAKDWTKVRIGIEGAYPPFN